VTLDAQRWALTVYADGEQFSVFAPDGAAVLRTIDPIAHAGEAGAIEGRLSAPMPGKLVALPVAPGQAVKKGQPLAVMEAMKMEHTIVAPRDGIVAELLYAVGDQVSEGGELLRLAPPAP
jgi:3-methylcrotonyl-CoA carboxylase alpha subunit